MKRRTGISNRESPEQEEQERQQFPPQSENSPQPESASGERGERPIDEQRQGQTSHKAGSRSVAQKEAESRYPDRSMPASHKVAGAFGAEPEDDK